MANLSFLKRLIKEDFAQKDQDLIGKIAFIFNPAIAQITNILNHGLLISDLNTQVKDIEITVDTDGVPTTETSFQSQLKGRCGAMLVGRAQAVTPATDFPTGGHSVSYREDQGSIIITNITGLPENVKFLVRLIAIV